jgi:hypothetical protein
MGFLGHLIYATGFMFLISCGYWQELIETLVWAHETPLANLVYWMKRRTKTQCYHRQLSCRLVGG